MASVAYCSKMIASAINVLRLSFFLKKIFRESGHGPQQSCVEMIFTVQHGSDDSVVRAINVKTYEMALRGVL